MGQSHDYTQLSGQLDLQNSFKQQCQVAPSILLFFNCDILSLSSLRRDSVTLMMYCCFQVRRTGGTYETHSSFRFRGISHLQLLNILVSLKASQQTPSIASQRLSGSFAILPFKKKLLTCFYVAPLDTPPSTTSSLPLHLISFFTVCLGL